MRLEISAGRRCFEIPIREHESGEKIVHQEAVMGELIKCSGRGCCEKNSCYRYLASTATWQLWFTQPPVNRSYPCPHYWQCHRGDCATERSLGRRATG